jgi:hypothetical protein
MKLENYGNSINAFVILFVAFTGAFTAYSNMKQEDRISSVRTANIVLQQQDVLLNERILALEVKSEKK